MLAHLAALTSICQETNFDSLARASQSACEHFVYWSTLLQMLCKWKIDHCLVSIANLKERLRDIVLTYGGIRHDDHNVCVWRENIDKSREICISYFHTRELSSQFTERTKVYLTTYGILLLKVISFTTNLQLSLNCLIIFETFSKRWTSLWYLLWQWLITRNVARSNRRTSSASIILANWFKLCSSSLTFGINI